MILSASFALVLFSTITHSLSVCDELDIAFLATPDSIIDSLDNIKTIMERVMHGGSSDSTDYSLMLYGENVPIAFQNTMIPIFNPTALEDLQNDLQQNPDDSTTTNTDIRVSDVIRHYKHHGATHYKPYLKQHRFREFSDHNYTATQYIVFADDISNIECDTKEDEINIILKHNISADSNIDSKCKLNVFAEYDLIHSVNKEMLRLHSITCSAKVLDDDHNEILLNHNAQFVDANSYIKCNIVFDEDYSHRLDSNKSYIYAIDGVDTKYKLNNYLIVTRDTLNRLPPSCKSALVYRVTNISTVSVQDLDFEGIDVNRTKLLRLSIASPRTVHEYIFKANIKKDQKLESESIRRLFIDIGPENRDILSDNWAKSGAYNPYGVDISYSVSFGININAFFKFNWDWFTENEELEFRIYGDYEAKFNFDVLVDNDISIDLPDVINVGKNSMVLWVGIIPIWVKPYLKTNVQLNVLAPVTISSKLECTHSATYDEGYKYSRINTYTPAYGLIAEDYYLYVSIWEDFGTGYTITSCAQSNYLYNDGYGQTCEYWAFKQYDGSCHCIASTWSNYAKPRVGWDLYKMGAHCNSPTTTCESDGTGCSGFDLYSHYQLDTYYDQKCYDSCYFSCSMFTCVSCDPWGGTNEQYIEEFHDEKISETKTLSNVCTKTYSVKENEGNGLCDTLKYDDQIGFDLIIEPVIGVMLYEIVDIYSRIPILNKFRIQPIETDPLHCDLSASTSVCQSDTNTIYVSFRITSSWSLYFGAVISVEEAFANAINALIGDPDIEYNQYVQLSNPAAEISMFEDATLFSGHWRCFKMIDLSSTLNYYLLNRCCGVPATTTTTSTTATTATTTTSTTKSTSTNSTYGTYGCNVTFPDFLNDGYCDNNDGYNTEACNYDGGDCCQQTCVNSSNICGINGYYCIDPSVVVSVVTNVSNGTYGCNATTQEYINDGYCDVFGGYNTEACHYDGGDCCQETCVNSSHICGTNGYHCVDPSVIATNVSNSTYGCNVTSPDWINDGYCDAFGGYNTAECNYDGGDCCQETCVDSSNSCGSNGYHCIDPSVVVTNRSNGTYECNVQYPDYINDGYCDAFGGYNTEACNYDGGDCCQETCVNSSSICGSSGYQCIDPSIVITIGSNGTYELDGCNVTSPDYINDGYCDEFGGYNTAECHYDGGDCCNETCTSSVHICGSNGYYCIDPYVLYATYYNYSNYSNDTYEWNDCNVTSPEYLNDGYCDHNGGYNTEACNYDGGDCCQETCTSSTYPCGDNRYHCVDPAFAPNGYNNTYGLDGCNVTSLYYINDGYCDGVGGYNTEACRYDGGDCCQETCVNSSNICGSNGYYCMDPSVSTESPLRSTDVSTDTPLTTDVTTETPLTPQDTTVDVLIGISEQVGDDEGNGDDNHDVVSSSFEYYVHLNFGAALFIFLFCHFFVFY